MGDGHHAGTGWLSEGRRRQLGGTILPGINGLTTSTDSPGLPLRGQVSRTKVLEHLAGLLWLKAVVRKTAGTPAARMVTQSPHSLTSTGSSIYSQYRFGARRNPEGTEGDTL